MAAESRKFVQAQVLAHMSASPSTRAEPATATEEPEEGLTWTRWAMMLLLLLPTAAPAEAATTDWKERLDRFNNAQADADTSDASEVRALPPANTAGAGHTQMSHMINRSPHMLLSLRPTSASLSPRMRAVPRSWSVERKGLIAFTCECAQDDDRGEPSGGGGSTRHAPEAEPATSRTGDGEVDVSG